MFKLLVFIAFLAQTYAFSARIVNGTDAGEGEFPFAVSLRINERHTCGATILNNNFALTAAHCVCDNNVPRPPADYSIQYGLTKITQEPVNRIQVAKITCNDFNMDTLIFDSAVLELETPLPDDGTWQRVTISKEFDTSVPQTGVIIGWGRLSDGGPLPENLQKLTVDVYDDALCGQSYSLVHHVCFGAPQAGACNGDSGTSLLVGGVQTGIASFITAPCGIATPEFPNVYSRVETYYDWIVSIAGDVNGVNI